MSWEPFDRWPGDGREAGAFRGASEPVLAKREGTSLSEWVRLTWHSGPDLPAGRVVARAAVTEHYVYVQRRDGSRARVARQALRGVRGQGPAVVIRVREAEDLFLLARDGCAVQQQLIASAGRGGQLRASRGVVGAVFLVVLGVIAAAGLFTLYGIEAGLGHLSRGLWTSETMLGLYAGLAALLVALLALLWLPSRTRVDATGVERRRGLVPWLSFRRPPEDFAAVGTVVERGAPRTRGAPVPILAVEACVELRERARFGTLRPVGRVVLRRFAVRTPSPSGQWTREAQDANDFAEKARQILGL